MLTEQVLLAHRDRKHHIVAQRVVVVQVLVAASQSQYPLRHHLLHRVLDPFRVSVIREARRQPPEQAHSLRQFPEKQRAAVSTRSSCRRGGLHPPPSKTQKFDLFRATVCRRHAGLLLLWKALDKLHLQQRIAWRYLFGEKYGLAGAGLPVRGGGRGVVGQGWAKPAQLGS